MSETVEILRARLQQYPERVELVRELTRALLRRDRIDEAAQAVLDLDQQVPGSPVAEALAKEVLAYRVERARLEPSPGPRGDLSSELRSNLETLWDGRHRGDGAVTLAGIRALRRHHYEDREADAALRLVRAVIQEHRGQLQDALTTYNEAVERASKRPRIAHALVQKGRLLQRIRRTDAAVAHYRRALRYEPENMAAVGALLRCGAEVEPELSDRWLEAVARLDGRTPIQALRDPTPEDR